MGCCRLSSKPVHLEQVVRTWGKWDRAFHWRLTGSGKSVSLSHGTATELGTQIKGTSITRLSQFREHDFWTVPIAFWVFSQPSNYVQTKIFNRDFQAVNTAVSSTGIWDSSGKKILPVPSEFTCPVLRWVAVSFISS